MEKSGEGKQEGCAKAQDSWPPTRHCPSWPKGQEIEISTTGRDCKFQCRIQKSKNILPFNVSKVFKIKLGGLPSARNLQVFILIAWISVNYN